MRLLAFLLSLLALSSCAETVDLYAPPEDIWVVYGVLDPHLTQQDFRISQAFQTESNTYAFAASHDPSVPDLQVWLSGDGKRWNAVQVDSILKDTSQGDFGAFTTVYRIETQGDHALKPGQTYQLTIARKADTTAFLQAQSRIPPEPQILSPTILGSFSRRCLVPVPFEDSVTLIFKKKRTLDIPGEAYRYQVGVRFQYYEDGQPRQTEFGPSRLFDMNQGCGNGGGGDILCYRYPAGAVMALFQQQLSNPDHRYTLDPDTLCGVIADLPRFLEVQVTAVDSALGRYMVANDPRFVNFNTYRREYSNLRGTEKAVGIFGSVNYHRVPVTLTPCGMYLLGLSPQASPSVCE